MIGLTGDLEADADSLSCIKSGLTSTEMHIDGSKLGSKRSRNGMTESYGQAGTGTMNEFGSLEVNEQGGSQWDWDDHDRGVVMDIQALLSEFGDFGDFFETDALPFGEPPGTEESQTPMFSATDGGDASSSPFTGMLDASDPMILPVGFSSFESYGIKEPTNVRVFYVLKEGQLQLMTIRGLYLQFAFGGSIRMFASRNYEKLWHGLSKTLAKKTAWALAMDRGLSMVSVNAGLLHLGDLKHEGPHNNIDRSCKVMMLGRFALQLLWVQNLKKSSIHLT